MRALTGIRRGPVKCKADAGDGTVRLEPEKEAVVRGRQVLAAERGATVAAQGPAHRRRTVVDLEEVESAVGTAVFEMKL